MTAPDTIGIPFRISRLTFILLACASVLFMQGARACAQAPQATNALHDGAHDFDFNFGVWHTQIRRIPEPFSNPGKLVELSGTVTVRKVWNGRAQLEEIEADGPDGHWEGMTIFLYNPTSHQWSQSFADSKDGAIAIPSIGFFKDGRGELYSQDTFHDRAILVQGVWSNITPDSHSYEESYSNDGGKTWHVAFHADLTREKAEAVIDRHELVENRQRDFDWDLGTWKIHMSRLKHPLTGSKEWAEMDGTTVNSPVWHGRANLAEVETDGPTGHLELLALRLYNPATHEWSVHFATSGVGVLNTPTGRPTVGTFTDGHGEFYDQEPYTNDRAIFVRFRIGPTSKNKAGSEQAFSDDGGKTWETNWVNKYTRMN